MLSVFGFFAKTLHHDCRRHLPDPSGYPNGAVLVCPECGRPRVQSEYEDDHVSDTGIAIYATWAALDLDASLADHQIATLVGAMTSDGQVVRAKQVVAVIDCVERLLENHNQPKETP